jgi:hypothetical protein
MYICTHICSHMRLFLPHVLYTVWWLSKSYALTIVKNSLLKKKKGKKQKGKAQQRRLGTNVRVCGFPARLLARGRFASGGSCDRPTRSRFSVVFFGPRANVELITKFHVALHASHVALPMITSQISPCTNVTLTSDFDIGLDHPVHGGYGWGSPTPRRRSNCQTKKLKSGYGARHQDELADRPSVAM